MRSRFKKDARTQSACHCCPGPVRQARGEKQRECGKGSRAGEDRTDTEQQQG